MGALADIAIERLRCLRCDALPGSRCRTARGNIATYPHSVRMRALELAWHVGYTDGARQVTSFIRTKCDPDKADLDPRGTLDRALTQMENMIR